MAIGKKMKRKIGLLISTIALGAVSFFGALSISNAYADEAEEFFMVDGAQVRVNFEDETYQNAIRFTTKLKKDTLPSDGNVKVVTMVVKTSRLTQNSIAENEFTKENLDDLSIPYKTIVFSGEDLTEVANGDYYIYNSCIVNLEDATISSELSARSYIEVDGVPTTYTDFDIEKNSTNLWDIAKEKVEEYKDNADYVEEVAKLEDLSASFNVTMNGYGKQETFEFKRGTSFAQMSNELYNTFTVENQSYYYGPKNIKVNGEEITDINATTIFTLDICKLENVTCDTENIGLVIENGVVTGVENKGSIKTRTNTLVVPSTYNGVPVTAVAQSAFNQVHGITHVVLADSVMTLGKEAFSQMDSLKTVVMPGVSEVATSGVDNQFVATPTLKKVVVGQNLNVTRQMFDLDGNKASAVGQIELYSTTIGGSIWLTQWDNRNHDWNRGVNYCWEYEAGTYEPVALAEHKYVGEDGVCEHCNHIFDKTAMPDYTWDAETQSYFITGSTKMTFATNDDGGAPSTNVVIPSWHNDGVHGDARVTRVKTLAFKGNTKITYLQLPYTVTKLGYKCLGAMTSLVTVKMTGKLYLTENTIDDLRGTYGLGNIFDESNNLKNVILGPDVYSADQVQFLRTHTSGDGLTNSAYTINVFCTDDSGEEYTIRGGGIRNVYVPGTGNNKTVYYCYRENEPTDASIKAKAWHYAEDGITPVKW